MIKDDKGLQQKDGTQSKTFKYEEAVNLKSSLEKPLAYHSRTIQILPTEASKV